MTGNDGIVTYAPVNPIGSLREAWSKASIESQFHKPGKTSTCPPPLCKSNRHSARQPTGKSSLVKSTCGVHNTWARSTPGALRERKIKRKISNCLKLTSKVQRAVRYIHTWPEQTNFKQSQVLPPTNTIITVSHSPPPPKNSTHSSAFLPSSCSNILLSHRRVNSSSNYSDRGWLQ